MKSLLSILTALLLSTTASAQIEVIDVTITRANPAGMLGDMSSVSIMLADADGPCAPGFATFPPGGTLCFSDTVFDGPPSTMAATFASSMTASCTTPGLSFSASGPVLQIVNDMGTSGMTVRPWVVLGEDDSNSGFYGLTSSCPVNNAMDGVFGNEHQAHTDAFSFVATTGGVVATPALGGWGIAALAAGLIGVAGAVQRRRR